MDVLPDRGKGRDAYSHAVEAGCGIASMQTKGRTKQPERCVGQRFSCSTHLVGWP